MGYLFEDLIRRFSEFSNETAGEHITPREVIRLIVELLLANDHAALTGTGIIRTVYMTLLAALAACWRSPKRR
jgi:type I restriction enzyme M protein